MTSFKSISDLYQETIFRFGKSFRDVIPGFRVREFKRINIYATRDAGKGIQANPTDSDCEVDTIKSNIINDNDDRNG